MKKTSKNLKTQIPATKEEAIRDAGRFYKNAKDTLKKSKIEYKTYKDSKYVREASAMAYLAALQSIDGYLIGKGVERDKLPTSIEEYWTAINKQIPKNGKLKSALTVVYQNLHIFAYYRGGVDVTMVKSGFESAKDILNMLTK